MREIQYTEDLFIERVLKKNVHICSIGFGNFLCSDNDGRWVAIINYDKSKKVINYIIENKIKL